MTFIDVLAILAVLAVLALLTYLTRSKDGCSSCHSDCSSCIKGKSFYEEYKREEAKKQSRKADHTVNENSNQAKNI